MFGFLSFVFLGASLDLVVIVAVLLEFEALQNAGIQKQTNYNFLIIVLLNSSHL